MSTLRFNIVTGKWAIVADKLDKRAEDPEKFFPRDIKAFGKRKEECPLWEARDRNKEFVPVWVQKEDLPKEIPTFITGFRRAGTRVDNVGDFMGDWTVCVKHNVAPFLPLIPSEKELKQVPGGQINDRPTFTWLEGMGVCDVVIETDKHDEPIGLLSAQHCEDMIDIYLDRFAEYAKDPRIEHIAIFGNHGIDAGATLEHPHSQIVATAGMIPAEIEWEFDHFHKWYREHGARCPMCTMLEDESKKNQRIVKENEHFVVLEPYASEFRFETWIVPKGHRNSFDRIDKDEKRNFAKVLTWVCGRIRVALDDTSYNYLLKTALPGDEKAWYHWYMIIQPRGLRPTGGFEEVTGLMVNLVAPEVAAEWLRKRGNALTFKDGSILQRSPEERLKVIRIIEADGDPITHEEQEIINLAKKLPACSHVKKG